MASMGIKLLKDGKIAYTCPFFPIGSIYMSVTDVNPAIYFGGTWEQINGRFLFACDDNHTAGSTGGEENHQLTIDEMPSHTHGYALDGRSGVNANGGTWFVDAGTIGDKSGATRTTKATGGGASHNNMPPYLSVYMWQRVE